MLLGTRPDIRAGKRLVRLSPEVFVGLTYHYFSQMTYGSNGNDAIILIVTQSTKAIHCQPKVKLRKTAKLDLHD